jgi:hypothetical protein
VNQAQEAFDADWWFENERDAAGKNPNKVGTPLRVRAIEVTVTYGDVSRKTRYEFDGGGPCAVMSPTCVIGDEVIVVPMEVEEDARPNL